MRVVLHGEDGSPGAGGEVVLEATDVILATGSRAKSLPGLEPDGERIVTSDHCLREETLPGSIIVGGAGAVGVEFASLYHDLGAKVTVLEYLPRIVPLEDDDVSAALKRSFEKRGIKVITDARFDPAAVKTGPDGVTVCQGPDGEEALVVAEIAPSVVAEQRQRRLLFRDRKPSAYAL